MSYYGTKMQTTPIKPEDNVFDQDFAKVDFTPLHDALNALSPKAPITRSTQTMIDTLNRREDVKFGLMVRAREAYTTAHGVPPSAQLMLNVFTNRTLFIDGGELTFGMRDTAGHVATLEGDDTYYGYMRYYCCEEPVNQQIVQSVLASIDAVDARALSL
jgi:hypothetical protein